MKFSIFTLIKQGHVKCPLLLSCFCFLGVVSGCVGSAQFFSNGYNSVAYDIANNAGLQQYNLAGDHEIGIIAFGSKVPAKTDESVMLRIYIEGDGRAYITPNRPSSNPSSANPVALKLMLADKYTPTVYMARPCQLSLTDHEPNNSKCSSVMWTTHRFSLKSVEIMNHGISELKERYHAKKIQLIGYSGGGVIAALVATKRDDVAVLITVASPLDLALWTRYHNISPLNNSLTPMDFIEKLRFIPQIHFVGSADKIVPPIVLNQYQQVLNLKTIYKIKDIKHGSSWEECWPDLVKRIN